MLIRRWLDRVRQNLAQPRSSRRRGPNVRRPRPCPAAAEVLEQRVLLSAVDAPDLIAHYALDGLLPDTVGKNEPVSASAVHIVPGEIGNGVKLDTGGYIDVPHSPSLTPQRYTVSTWVRPDGPGATNGAFGDAILGKGVDSSTASMQLLWRSSDGRFIFLYGNVNDGEYVTSQHGFAAGQFYHVAATYDGTSVRLFVNGVLEAEAASSNAVAYNAAQPWTIGSNPPTGRANGVLRTFNGVIDDLRIFGRALDVAEISALADPTTSSPLSGELAHYTFDSVDDAAGTLQPSAFNAVTTVSGEIGNGVKLGGGGYIDIPHSMNLTPQRYTISAWVRPDGPGATADEFGNSIVAKGIDPYHASAQLLWRSNDEKFVFLYGSNIGGEYLTSQHSFGTNQFHYVAATYDGAKIRLFVDGDLEAETTYSNPVTYNPNEPWTIGANNERTTVPRTFNGVIDDVRIYDRALTSDEILTSYQQPNGFPLDGLDGGFGGTGRVTTDLQHFYDYGYGVAQQADGKLLVVGQSVNSVNGSEFGVTRYNTDGTLDASFGNGGRVITHFPIAGGTDWATSVAVQSDGKIVVGGTSYRFGNYDFALARYNTNGSLDTTFGSGGVVKSNFSAEDYIYDIALQDDPVTHTQKIVVAGVVATSFQSYNFAIARYNANGSLDSSFGSGGLASIDFGGATTERAQSLTIQPDGKIIAVGAGYYSSSATTDLEMLRLTANGTPDGTFGSGGRVVTAFGSSTDFADAVALQADGKIVVAGNTVAGSGGSNFALARYNSNGTLDGSFGAGGKVVTDFWGQGDSANGVVVLPDGSILAGGGAAGNCAGVDFALARYTAAGVLDTNFGNGGKLTTDFAGGYDTANDMLLQSDGHVVLAGSSAAPGGGFDFAVARYGGDVVSSVSGDPLVVTTADDVVIDDCQTSLREAILYANSHAGVDTISFNLSGGGVHTIHLTSALPTITDAVILDGTTQAGFAGTPLVELDGSAAGANASGLTLRAGGSTVRGLVINRFGQSGIDLQGSGGNIIAGNYIGTDATGTNALANGSFGVRIDSLDNRIGTTTDATADSRDRNVISGNGFIGVRVTDNGPRTGNVIAGNYIGTTADGMTALANQADGVSVGSNFTTICGTTAAARNVIAGNRGRGVTVDSGKNGTVIQGNYIGTNAAGTLAVANQGDGITVFGNGTLIGGTMAGAGNLISGNARVGIWMQGTGAHDNLIQGNLIGTDVTGMTALGNGLQGVGLLGGAANNLIGGAGEPARNVISGNKSDGVQFNGGTGNRVQGNYIGVSADGKTGIGNVGAGVSLNNGSTGALVGGAAAAERNVISANGNGVIIQGNLATRNRILGNYIGTNAAGAGDLGNQSHGVFIFGRAADNVIGAAGAGNVISGNGNDGIFLAVGNTSGTGAVVQGNLIGTNAAGDTAIRNGSRGIEVQNTQNVQFGGLAAGEGNVISGNAAEGILIYGTSTGNTIAGNRIGTNAGGTALVGSSNTIGVALSTADNRILGNVISGNRNNGIRLSGAAATGNRVQGNFIGTGADGTATVANGAEGILVSGAQGTLIGTDGDGVDDAAEGNVISGNASHGIHLAGAVTPVNSLSVVDRMIAGTLPSTTATGTIEQADLRDGSGGHWGYDNPIPGGGGDNYAVVTTGTLAVGTAGTYSFAIGSDDGGRLRIDGADVIVDNTLHAFADHFGQVNLTAGTHTFEWVGFEQGGGAGWELSVAAGTNNSPVSTANGWHVVGDPDAAIALQGAMTVTVYHSTVVNDAPTIVAGNRIGTNAAGDTAIANTGHGILIDGGLQHTLIGTNADGTSDDAERNIISGNLNDGVLITGRGTTDNTIAGNRIGTNADGTAALANRWNGVELTTADNHIAGNLISGNANSGVVLRGDDATGNRVQGNRIGTNADGTQALGNGVEWFTFAGVWVQSGAQGNWVGTDSDGTNDAAEGNLISGNTGYAGVWLDGDGNTVAGNRIGTNAAGTGPLGNGGDGVYVTSADNLIGGMAAGAGNLISGNAVNGVELNGDEATGNRVQGNFIGGVAALGNDHDGVLLANGATFNVIGVDGDGVGDATEGNVIASNGGHGVNLRFAGTDQNVVAGNFIGTDATGTVDLGNRFDGVQVRNGARFNLIGTNGDGVSDAWERNVISGNGRHGVDIFDLGTDSNVVAGNEIGTTAGGTTRLANGSNGVFIHNGAQSNLIGTDGDGLADEAGRNVISGNGGEGVFIQGAGTDGTVVAGNYIGTNAAGTASVMNGNHGVRIEGGAANTVVGTNGDGRGDASEGNLISGNRYDGVSFWTGGAVNTVIAGNRIGTDREGKGAISNGRYGIWINGGAAGTRIGTDGDGLADDAERNIISGNADIGVLVSGFGTDGTVIAGNFIGTTADGMTALANRGNAGVIVQSRAANTRIGTDGNGMADAAERNVISGNSQEGIQVESSGTTGTVIAGNLIGTNAAGDAAVANGFSGILVWSGATNTRIGTNGDGVADAIERNVISGNSSHGIAISGSGTTGNVVQGNRIGTNAAGTAALGNGQDGVQINNAAGNLIGGTGAGAGNVISASGDTGITIVGGGATGNAVQGNLIGTDATGTAALGNRFRGIFVWNTADNVIGGTEAGAGNVIAVTEIWEGLGIFGSTRIIVQGNWIGTNTAGDAGLGNEASGIEIEGSSDLTIGGAAAGARNVISGNSGSGIRINGSTGVVVQGNAIGVGPDGASHLGNSTGIYVDGSSTDNLIGTNGDGTADAAEGNLIAFNRSNGVAVIPDTAVRNTIRGNSLYDNTGLGITLKNGGVTPNDLGDGDAGPNLLQNFPGIGTVETGATTHVTGTLSSTADMTFTLDFYANAALDPSGNGEGERWLGSAKVTTDAAGLAVFDVTLSAATAGGEFITATATDPDGNTSEFSGRLPVADAGGPYTVPEGGSVLLSAAGSNDPDQPDNTTLRYAWDLDGDGTFETAGMTAIFPAAALDGPTSRTVRLRVTDATGLSSETTAAITVTNVAPTATLSNGGPVDEGSPVMVGFADPSDPSAADTTAGFHYSFALSAGDLATSYATAVAADNQSFTFDDNGAYTVYGRIFDKDGGFTDYSTEVTVTNVAPTAMLGNSGPVDEGSPILIGFAAPSDPSAADTIAGFRYSFALSAGDLATSYAAAAAADNQSFTFEDNGTYTVYGRIFDKDGGFTEYSTDVTVTNVAPTVFLSGPADGVRGQMLTYMVSASDPSLADRQAGFAFTVDWGDGTQTAVARQAGQTQLALSHVYADADSYTVTALATDKDGADSATASAGVTINVFSASAGGDLIVGGTTGDDRIAFTPHGPDGVRVILNGQRLGDFDSPARIVAYGQAGDDDIQVSGGISVDVWLYGDAGNDRLSGGGGRNVLLGGSGDDRLSGGNDRDLLIGGTGADRLMGIARDDILIGGVTDFDYLRDATGRETGLMQADSQAALQALLTAWSTGTADAQARAALLHDGVPGGEGQSYALDNGRTVHADGAADVLTGNGGTDWFLLDSEDEAQDLRDKVFAGDLDFLFG